MRKRNYIKTGRSAGTARKKMLLIAGGGLLGVYLLVSFVLGEMGMVKYYRMKAQYNAISEEIAHLKQDNIRLIHEVRALKTDSAYIERLARDKLGLARPGEIVYYYKEPETR